MTAAKKNPANDFATIRKTPMTAKRLILSLFGALDDDALSVSKLIVGGGAFGIEETAIRVAANRLANDGVLRSPERGLYEIGAHGAALYEASRAWQRQNERLREWRGGWYGVHVAHLGRSDRKAMRARQRAFVLCGFAELEDGLWLRPDNLTLSAGEIAAELVTLGLPKNAPVLRAAELIHPRSVEIGALWDRQGLEANYRAALHAMAEREPTLVKEPLPVAARTVLELGSSVVHVLTHDPLLPDAFVDAALRRQVYDTMLRFDALGKSIWEALFNAAGSTAQTPTARRAKA